MPDVPFYPDVQLYILLALIATLASILGATHASETSTTGSSPSESGKSTLPLRFGPIARMGSLILGFLLSWLHIIVDLFGRCLQSCCPPGVYVHGFVLLLVGGSFASILYKLVSDAVKKRRDPP